MITIIMSPEKKQKSDIIGIFKHQPWDKIFFHIFIEINCRVGSSYQPKQLRWHNFRNKGK